MPKPLDSRLPDLVDRQESLITHNKRVLPVEADLGTVGVSGRLPMPLPADFAAQKELDDAAFERVWQHEASPAERLEKESVRHFWRVALAYARTPVASPTCSCARSTTLYVKGKRTYCGQCHLPYAISKGVANASHR